MTCTLLVYREQIYLPTGFFHNFTEKKCTYTYYMYNANDEETTILLRFYKAKSKTTMFNFIILIFFMWAVFSTGGSKCLLMQIGNRRDPLNIRINA